MLIVALTAKKLSRFADPDPELSRAFNTRNFENLSSAALASLEAIYSNDHYWLTLTVLDENRKLIDQFRIHNISTKYPFIRPDHIHETAKLVESRVWQPSFNSVFYEASFNVQPDSCADSKHSYKDIIKSPSGKTGLRVVDSSIAEIIRFGTEEREAEQQDPGYGT